MLQTRCSNMVEQAEQEAKEQLAKERAHFEQSMDELERQLAKRQTKLAELETSLAVEKASSRDTKIVVSKEVERVQLTSQPTEPTLIRYLRQRAVRFGNIKSLQHISCLYH